MRSTVSPDYDPNRDVKRALKDYKVDFKIATVECRKLQENMANKMRMREVINYTDSKAIHVGRRAQEEQLIMDRVPDEIVSKKIR